MGHALVQSVKLTAAFRGKADAIAAKADIGTEPLSPACNLRSPQLPFCYCLSAHPKRASPYFDTREPRWAPAAVHEFASMPGKPIPTPNATLQGQTAWSLQRKNTLRSNEGKATIKPLSVPPDHLHCSYKRNLTGGYQMKGAPPNGQQCTARRFILRS